jgi:NAD(P)-dependent dehydrogenase (short-subunit alcohol dehydrogenase family)
MMNVKHGPREEHPVTVTDPVAVVTGAASGIGRATCERLVAAGCRVVAVDRDADRLDGLRTSAITGIVADVADPGDRQALVAEVERTGGLDYLVNAAGILRTRALPDVTLDDVRSVFAVNLEAPLFLSLDLASRFHVGGAIVNVSSAAAKLGTTTELAVYAASKAALLSVTRTLAFGFAAQGLRVNAVCPGIIDTPMQGQLLQSLAESRRSSETDVDVLRLSAVPFRRAGEPAEVAEAIWFLLSPAASYMTGQAINVTGGQVTW